MNRRTAAAFRAAGPVELRCDMIYMISKYNQLSQVLMPLQSLKLMAGV